MPIYLGHQQTTKAMKTSPNTNWKNEVRAFFASKDEVAYRKLKGMSAPSFTEVKVEILNRRTTRKPSHVVSSAVENLFWN